MTVPTEPARNSGLDGFTRTVFDRMPLLNAALLLWVLVSSAVAGAVIAAWFRAPVVLVEGGLALTLTTVLARRQPPGRPRWLLTVEAVTQVVLWLAMAVFGAAVVNNPALLDPIPEEDTSVLVRIFGRGALEVSNRLSEWAYVIACGSWLVLLVTLVVARWIPAVGVPGTSDEPTR